MPFGYAAMGLIMLAALDPVGAGLVEGLNRF
jgi:hypothetical protein